MTTTHASIRSDKDTVAQQQPLQSSRQHPNAANDRYYDIIVIGAGMAGLSAAQHLQDAIKNTTTSSNIKHSVLVLEARDRLGGRTFTVVDDGSNDNQSSPQQQHHHQQRENESTTSNNSKSTAPSSPPKKGPIIHLDMGATWVHGSKKGKQPIALLADAMGYELRYHGDNGDNVYNADTGENVTARMLDKAYQSLRAKLKQAKQYAKSLKMKKPHGKDISMQEALERVDPDIGSDPVQQYIIRQRLEFDLGGPTDTLSASQFDDDSEFAGGDSIPLRGYKPIVDHLASGLNIQLNTAIHTIEYDTTGVRLHTNCGTIYRAKRVVCTIPLGVLKSGAVTFEPELSESKQTAIRRLGWGVVNKVGLLFDEVMWQPTDQIGFGIVSKETTPFCQYILSKYPITQVPMLEAYMVGKRAMEMKELGDDEVIDKILADLSTLFDHPVERLKRSLKKTYIQRWDQEVFTRGGYSYASPESNAEDFEAFEYSQLRVLYFAGEHTDVDYRGTAHGAFLSGRRAARDVLKSLGVKFKLPSPVTLGSRGDNCEYLQQKVRYFAGDHTNKDYKGTAHRSFLIPKVETALDWQQRCYQKRLRRQLRKQKNSDEPSDLPWWAISASSSAAAVEMGDSPLSDPSLHFLWSATSGIAPMDSAWKQAVASSLQRLLSMDESTIDLATVPPPPPPAILLEGPSDCGKTWMLLTTAARFLVATRPSAYGGRKAAAAQVGGSNANDQSMESNMVAADDGLTTDSNNSQEEMTLPEVIFMDSNFDFSIAKLAHIIRSTLSREYDNTAKTSNAATDVVAEHALFTAIKTNIAEQNILIEEETEECLSRIHVVQVDYGATDWVPVLEVLRHQLAGKRRNTVKGNVVGSVQSVPSAATALNNDTPTLMLWDGFLEDIGTGHDESSTREILLQMSRLLQQEWKNLWWVLSLRSSTRAPTGNSRKGTGQQIMDWMQQQQQNDVHRDNMLPRETVRVQLDRPTGLSVSKSSAYAVLLDNNDTTANGAPTEEKKILYALSLQGILS